MTQHPAKRPQSQFEGIGLQKSLASLVSEVQELYLSDDAPWIVGYSGGKDSTATLQLVWLALSQLDRAQRAKRVHVISTDTLVENPVVAAWVTHSLERMQYAAAKDQLPFEAHRLTPEVADS